MTKLFKSNQIKVWFDKEGDYLEVLFENKKGYFKETKNDAVMEKIDAEGNVISFSVLNVSTALQSTDSSIHWDSFYEQETSFLKFCCSHLIPKSCRLLIPAV